MEANLVRGDFGRSNFLSLLVLVINSFHIKVSDVNANQTKSNIKTNLVSLESQIILACIRNVIQSFLQPIILQLSWISRSFQARYFAVLISVLPGWGRRVSCSIVRKAKEDEIENQVRIEIQALASSFLKISTIRKNWIECHSIGSKFDGRESTSRRGSTPSYPSTVVKDKQMEVRTWRSKKWWKMTIDVEQLRRKERIWLIFCFFRAWEDEIRFKYTTLDPKTK